MVCFSYMKTIIIGADHAGFKLKERMKDALEKLAYTVVDVSPRYVKGDDYPAIGMRAARRVAKTNGRGILICGSGVGMVIAANRIRGARAVLGHDAKEIARARTDNDVNILVVSSWNTSLPMAMGMFKIFIKTKSSNMSRHRRRVNQLG